jgi:hypothetical protein
LAAEKQKSRRIGIALPNSSNYATELSLTGERCRTKSATKIPQVRRLKWKSTGGVERKARLFLWEWIFTG